MISPLLETDLDEPGILDPSTLRRPIPGFPKVAVMCFFQEVIAQAGGTECGSLSVYGGRPVFETERDGRRVAFFYPGVGAPVAVAAMEEVIAFGCRTFLAVGGAGALVADLELGAAMVVDQALRDEGTSHHYLPPSRFVASDPGVSAALVAACERRGVAVRRGKTWTTDAIFRETRSRLERRVREGCSMVDMEAAAFFAVAQHRHVRIGQLLYAGDALAGEDWDDRGWATATHSRQALFDVVIDAAASVLDDPEPRIGATTG